MCTSNLGKHGLRIAHISPKEGSSELNENLPEHKNVCHRAVALLRFGPAFAPLRRGRERSGYSGCRRAVGGALRPIDSRLGANAR